MIDMSLRKQKNNLLNKGLIILMLVLSNGFISAQTPGMIIENRGILVLDPNGDGYVSQKTNGIQIGFTIPPDNDVTTSEIPYVAIVRPDPTGDLLRGPTGSFSEIVGTDAAGNNAIMVYNDGTNLLFRFRLGGYAPNSKSYSVLIDTDQKFGSTGVNADPNAVTGNLGFEMEIVLKTNFSVDIYNVDGTTSGIQATTHPYATFCQKAVAISTAGGDPDYFYDFYVPLSDFSDPDLAALGITSNTPLRFVALTVMNPNAAIGNNALSDVGGVTSGTNLDAIFTNLIDTQTPTTTGTINSGGVLDRTACPTISGTYYVSSTTVTGTSTEADGTVIQVYKNGVAAGATVTVTSGSWSRNGLTFIAGDVITATALASGKGVSYNNCSSKTVLAAPCTTPAPIAIGFANSGKVEVTFTLATAGTKTITVYNGDGTVWATTTSTSTTANTIVALSPGIPYTSNNKVPDGTYRASVTFGGCESTLITSCFGTTNIAAPTIDSPIAQGATTVAGSGVSGDYIRVFVDNVLVATTTVNGSNRWSVSVPALTGCQSVTAAQGKVSANNVATPGNGGCETLSSAVTVTSRTAASPTINSSGCYSSPPTSISGNSNEIGATVTIYRTSPSAATLGTAIVQSNGTWNVTSLVPALSSNDVIIAKVSSSCLTTSAASPSVTITTQTNIANYTIGINDPTEGQTAVTGTISGGTYNAFLNVYIDQTLIGSGVTVTGAGNWSVTVPANSLYVGGKINVTLTSPTGCESNLSSASAIVQCTPPLPASYAGGDYPYCYGKNGQITLTTSQAGVIYQLVNTSGVAVGPASMGDGGAIPLSTYALTSDLSNILVKASKLGSGSCSSTSSTIINFTPQSPSPTVTFTSLALSVEKGTTTLNFPYTAKSSSPSADKYTISYSTAAKNQGFSDVLVQTVIPVSPIILTIPAAPAPGTYSGTITIYETSGTSCTTNYSFNITIYAAGQPPVISVQPSDGIICTGSTKNLTVTAASSTAVTYQWQSSSSVYGPFVNVADGSGGTTNSYTTAALAATKYYQVIATNASGNITSRVAEVSVISGPAAAGVITGNATVCAGSTGIIYSVASITNATSYTWSYSGTGATISGNTSAININFATGATSGTLSVAGTNSCGNGTQATLAISVNPNPTAPTGTTWQSFCGSATVSNLTATGTTIQWYATSSGGSALPGSTTIVDGNHYYASQIVGGCESNSRLDVTASIIAIPAAPTASATQSFCGSATVSNLNASAPVGSTVKWYAAASGGSALAAGTALANATTYYAESENSTTLCVSSSRTAVAVTINALPATPTATATQSFCGSATVASLAATAPVGSTVKWYAAISGGSSLAGATALVNGSTYYAESENTTSLCVSSSRTAVTVTINALPTAPTTTATQSFCGSSTVASLAATAPVGSTVKWYAASSGGSSLAGATALVNGSTYYAESENTTSLCVSSSRTAVAVTINTLPAAPTATATQSFCGSATVVNLAATAPVGSTVKWYAASSGGSSLAGATALVNGSTYYAESENTTSLCVSSSRTAVTVTINALPTAPTATATQSFCGSATVASLAATAPVGSTVKWYAAASGGSALAAGNALTTATTYYAESENSTSLCVSASRTAVTVTINALPAAPTASVTTQPSCADATGTITITAPTGVGMTYSIDGSTYTNTTGVFTGLTVGTYTVTAKSSAGCISPATTSVTLNATICTNLSIAKTVDNSTPNIGSNVEFTITVTNNGPDNATGVTATDNLPSGYTYVSDNGSGAYNVGTGVWAIGNLNNGASATLKITATVKTSGNYANTATVNGDQSDPTPANNTSTSTPIPANQCNLSIDKSVSNGSPNIGDNIVFTLTVTNNGPNDATGVKVTDNLPSGYTYVSDNGVGAYNSETGLWTIGNLANGATATLNITVIVKASGTYSNTATVTGDQTDPTPGNNSDTSTPTPGALSNLSIIKSVDNLTPNVGSNVVFTLTATNNGPSDASGVKVTDLLPSGYTYVSDNGSGAYNSTSGEWNVGNLTNGASNSLNITATVKASGTYTNTATISGDQTDPTPANNSASATTTPVAQSNLSIVKSVDNATPNVGSNVVFTLTVTNNGPSDATGVSTTDALPSGYTYVSDNSSGAYDNGTGVWTIGNLANGASASLDITAKVNASGSYANTATVSSPVADPTPGNNTSTSTPVPVPQSNLSIVKSVDNSTPNVGSNVVFTLTVTNNGPSDATGVSASDALPSGYTYVSDNGSGAYDNGTGIWTIGNLANGASASLDITAKVNASGSYANTATVSSPVADPTPGNNTSTSTPVPVPQSNLSIVKSVDNSTPNVSSNVVFTLTVTNNGPSDATGVSATDVLPSGYTYISDNGSGTYNNGTGVWTIGNLANGASVSINITAKVNASGSYANTATVSSPVADPTPGNNTSTSTPAPVPQSNLSISKSVDNATPNVGSNVVFTLTVTNNGPSDATGVSAIDALPSGYTYVSDNSSGAYDNGTGVWTIGNLANGASTSLDITAKVNASGSYVNTATVTSPVADPTPGNNTSTSTPVPVPQSNLSITKSVSNGAPIIGSNIVFTLTATNHGPSDATGVKVTDILPSGFTYVSDDGSGAYNSGTGLWTVGTLANGATATLNMTVTVNATGNYANTASATGDQADPNSGNNSDTSTPTPGAQSNLSITKTVDNSTPNVGSNVVFTISVTNNGPNAATGVEVTDVLPTGYTYVSDNTTGEYNSSTGLWSVGNMNNGVTKSIDITAQVNASGNYTNSASVTGDQPDPSTGDNTASVSTTPVAQSNLTIVKTVNNSTPNVGSNVVFTLTVTNNGPSNASGVKATDVLPSGYTYVSDNGSGAYNSGTGVWTIGNLNNGATVTLDITTRVNATGNYTNTATVTGDQPDPNTGDETSSVTTTPNFIPVAINDNTSTNQDTPVTIAVLTNDTGLNDGPVVVTVTVNPTHGTFVVNADNTVTYTPNAGFTGTDTFTYQVCDSNGDCATATVTVTVDSTGTDHLPVAVDDNASTEKDKEVVISVLANDTGLEDGGLVVTVINQPTHGTVVINADNTITYIPEPGYAGEDSFTYQVCDADGDCSTAIVNITIENTIIIPDGFSPNGDGINDNFVIPGLENYNRVSIDILNRWGNIVYKSSNYKNNWDGTANTGLLSGQVLPTGTYFYVLHIHDNGRKATGYVYLNK